MFTGIIEYLGAIVTNSQGLLVVKADKKLLSQVKRGSSIAVEGICLTVVEKKGDAFAINYMPETAKKTTIGFLKKGNLVNLELPVTVKTFFAGHVVLGHIDCTTKIVAIEEKGNSKLFTFSLPKQFKKYIVPKGSIAVNGISLTIIDVSGTQFTIGIIPYTWDHTMLHTVKPGSLVNIEVDIFAKYLEKILSK